MLLNSYTWLLTSLNLILTFLELDYGFKDHGLKFIDDF